MILVRLQMILVRLQASGFRLQASGFRLQIAYLQRKGLKGDVVAFSSPSN
jgi:hypothetical protein